MPAAPIAKGVIIMCAVLIAAGYTVYENREQVMDLVDKTRRKISHAMHTFADEIMPPSSEQRQPMVNGGRQDGNNRRVSRANSRSRSRRNSADSITLRGDDEKAEGTSRDKFMADSALRYRPAHRGFSDAEASNSMSEKTPFDDDNKVLFDATNEAPAPPLPPRRSSPLALRRAASDASSDTLSPAMSEKGFPIAEASAPLIPAVLPVVPVLAATADHDTSDAPSPALPPRPSSVEEVVAPVTTTAAVIAEAEPQQQQDDEEDSHIYASSQPHWAIQQWTEEITADDHAAESEAEADDFSAVQSLHSESEAASVIDSDEGEEDDVDDRVEIVSDMASSMGDTDGWSEVGSTFSDGA